MNGLFVLIVLLGLAAAAPEPDSGAAGEPQNDSSPALKSEARTVARWTFESERRKPSDCSSCRKSTSIRASAAIGPTRCCCGPRPW
ncbi:MAG TPA: hypothetical protein VG433_00085 [Pirellulales bacterium]|jgi:hypothetical protein|nr:hypothetical protein [Pirellulales bacterium]